MTWGELYFTQLEDLNNYISLRKKNYETNLYIEFILYTTGGFE